MKERVTIQDIADALGISRNTVSKAINNSDGIAAATRERILDMAVEMGYKQFSYVQSLAESVRDAERDQDPAPGSAGEIALISGFAFTGSHYATTMVDRMQVELSQLGYRLAVYYVSPQEIRELQLPYPLPNEKTKALICIEIFDRAYSRMLCELKLPVLFVDGPAMPDGRDLAADLLLMDNRFELRRLIIAMLREGKKQFGFIGNPYHCQSFFERYMALRSSLMLENVPFDERFLIDKNHPIEVYHGLSQLEKLPDVFICANDYIAIDAITILGKLGKSVPQDVMICGFDDSEESRSIQPTLTTVHIHTQSMAYSAAQLLVTRLREPSLDFRTLYTQTDLMLRESAHLKDGGAIL